MRRSTATCAALTVLLLAGCTADPPDGSSTGGERPTAAAPSSAAGLPAPPAVDHDADVAALARVTLTGNLGTMPFFTFDPPLTLTGEVARRADEGTGRAVEPGHAVAVHVASLDAKTETITASSYEEGQGPELLLADEGSLPPALYEALVGARVGSRILFGAPVDGATTIYSFEILATAPVFARAEGTAVTPQAGVPAIALADDGEPTMTPVDGEPPADLVVQPLITGAGDPVGADSWLVLHYSTWLWDGTPVASSWDDGGPTVMRMSDALAGWQEGLAGQTIGSQVMLVAPPASAYGTEAREGVPAGSTVVFVVDILGGM